MARTHVSLQLRWGDQDVYGHVNNVAYARLLEEARARLFWGSSSHESASIEEHFLGKGPDRLKMLIANQSIEFLRVLDYTVHDAVVEIWIGKLGGASFEIHYEIVDGSKAERTVVARAISVAVMVDGVTMKPVRITAEGRARAKAWMDEPLKLGRA